MARTFGAACLKLAPAFEIEWLRRAPPGPHSWQWVSLRRELNEVALWMGATATTATAAGAAREVLTLLCPTV